MKHTPWIAALAVIINSSCEKRPSPFVPATSKPSTTEETAPEGPAFQFPTANRELLRTGGEVNFFTPTNPERPWSSGAFGCVRNSGTRLHEGIDIMSLKRDDDGESVDAVMSSRSGKVVHINRNISASNYGKYIVLLHEIERFPIYTLYAHLRKVKGSLAVGDTLDAGAILGTLGRTSNTKEGIPRERAHLHFEIGIQVNPKFSQWFDGWYKGGNNFHGNWNGLNLLGLDAAAILKQADAGSFKMLEHLNKEKHLCRILIFNKTFNWLKQFPQLIEDRNPKNTKAIQAWELDLNFNGIPVRAVPIRDEIHSGGAKYRILHVDKKILNMHPCSGLVFLKGQQWVFTAKGRRSLDLLLFR
jgi:murein DD-endopeptidase MepM/ murein hydrolase activator NlpD|tara:strand:- start:612 stop:1685 length:1074 start_codon:yes stop_codon:yes gene_type:complete